MRLLFVAFTLVLAAPLHAQSALYRPPNLGGVWVPAEGNLQFNFIHRFRVFPSGSGHKVVNYPTFALALGFPARLAVGLLYGSNSTLVTTPFRPNETELFARVRLGAAEGTDGLSVALTPAWNSVARSADGEISADYTRGPITILGAVRYASRAFDRDTGRTALAGGLVWRVTEMIALSGDIGSFISPAVHAAWSAAVDIMIPGSPHTLALEASNVTVSTIEGNSIGGRRTLYGFEFTVPIRLSSFGALVK